MNGWKLIKMTDATRIADSQSNTSTLAKTNVNIQNILDTEYKTESYP